MEVATDYLFSIVMYIKVTSCATPQVHILPRIHS